MGTNKPDVMLEDFPNENSNVFLMVRFRESDQYEAIDRLLSEILSEYSLSLIRADSKYYDEELWANVRRCMNSSRYGIAVFDYICEPFTSPNVSFELGYMLGSGKRCLLLREKNVHILQADLIGHLCYEFDAERIKETVDVAVRRWLRDIGIAKKPNEKRLVFVSSGGTCRDPMASAILLKLLEDRPPGYELQIRAAAVGPLTDNKASSGARKAIREMYGEDLLTNHTPILLTARMKTEADLILLMDHSLVNPKTLPAEKKKTFVFNEFFDLEGDIEDPWRDPEDEGSAARYAECASELKAILTDNLDRLLDFLRPTAIMNKCNDSN